ncbi:MAG: BT4734/BF3469 family protein [Bacteroidota bacterium]
MLGNFSFYKNGITNKIPARDISVFTAINMIKGDTYRDDVERLRNSADEQVRASVKRGLPYFTFSGRFKERSATGLIAHSGIICLDFDDVADLQIRKGQLCALPFVLACFLSPSGTGLKALVKIDAALHLESFVALEEFFKGLGLEVDRSGKDIPRACFVSYDPEIYYNPESAIFEVQARAADVISQAPAPMPQTVSYTAPELKSELDRIDFIVSQLEEQGIDITNNEYDLRLEVGFSLATLGEDARALYHRAVQFNDAYTQSDADYKFNDALQKGRFTTPSKFFALAKAAGVLIHRPKTDTTTTPAPVEVVEAETIPPFELLNRDPSTAFWNLAMSERVVKLMHASNVKNVVYNLASLTKEVADELRAIGNKVRLISADPAEDLELCDALVAHRFVLSIEMPEGEPKSYENWLVTNFTVDRIAAGDDMSQLQLDLCEHVSWFTNSFHRETIAKDIAKLFKVRSAMVTKEINDFIRGREDQSKTQVLADGEAPLPPWLSSDREKCDFYWQNGWVPRSDGFGNTGLYFATGNGPKKLTNFVINPLVHIYSPIPENNRRFTELNNGISTPVLQMPGKAFTSLEVFDSMLSDESNFFTIDGFTKSHLNRLKAFYLGEYPKCHEIDMLGWQPEGFFSFSNMIYKKGLFEYNKYGYAEVDGQNFLSMGASNALEGVRGNNDIYKNDKYLCYKESPITIEKWCSLMHQVYLDHGMMAIVFVMMSVFRDILFKRNNNFPLLYFYGPVESGKSKIAESVANVFTHNMPMFNLSNGTDFAFFNLMERFANVAVGFNEFDENTIKDNWFTAFKGAFDGEGRPKGLGKKNKSTTQAINVAIVMVGQYLSTKDDNSVLSRAIPSKITPRLDRTVEELALYDELKSYEKKGISSLICELLAHREFVDNHFLHRYVKMNAELKADLLKDGITPKGRLLENYSVALTMANLMGEKIHLPFSHDTFKAHCKAEIIKVGMVMAESNSLSQFWKTVEFLLDQGLIEQGNHYKVESLPKVRILIDRTKADYKTFEEPKKLLFLRLSTIHMLYATEIRRQTGKSGQNEQTIITYMKDQASYIGSNPGSMFAHGTNTSSYVFDYDLLGVNLERFKDTGERAVELTGTVYRDAEITDVIGTPKLSFTLLQDESYPDEATGTKVKKEILTNCTSQLNNMVHLLKKGREIKVTGTLIDQKGGSAWRRMGVTHIEIVEAELVFAPEARPDDEVNEIFGEEGV